MKTIKQKRSTKSPTGSSPFIVVHVHNDSEDKSSINISSEALELESVTRIHYRNCPCSHVMSTTNSLCILIFMELHALK